MMCEESLPVTFDADSFNCGKIVRCIVGDHNNRVTDLTAIIVERNNLALDCYNQEVNDKVFKTLSSSSSDSDHVPCVIQQNTYYSESCLPNT